MVRGKALFRNMPLLQPLSINKYGGRNMVNAEQKEPSVCSSFLFSPYGTSLDVTAPGKLKMAE